MEYVKGSSAKKLASFELLDMDDLAESSSSASNAGGSGSNNISGYRIEDHRICNVEDSLPICLDTLGEVDIHYMAWLSGADEDEVIKVHNGKTILQRPEKYHKDRQRYENWLLIPVYLRGNLSRLLNRAKKLNALYAGLFEENVRVIKEALPDMPDITDIHVQLGSSWINPRYIEDFVMDLFKLSYRPQVFKCDGKWKLQMRVGPVYVDNYFTYGTDRMPASSIIEHTLNASTIKIQDEVDADTKSGKKKVTNKQATYVAQTKQELIKNKFNQWIEEHPDVRDKMAKDYFETYSYITKSYDGSYLSLKDKNPDVTLYKHQVNAIARILLNKNTVLCHDVGSGKTYCFVAAVHELHRLGLSKKNMIVVPNNVFNDTVSSHKHLYPEDNLLTISPDDFGPMDRLKTINKIIENDYVAIYIAASKFDMLGMSLEYMVEQYGDEYEELYDRRNQASSRWEEKQLKKKQEKIARTKDKLQEEYKFDVSDCFDKLGITTLVVDEVHNYKNVSIETTLENVVGMHKNGSKKADSLLDKVRCVQKAGGRVVFATGTLLTNSISDLFVFQKYLQPYSMNDCSVGTFGEWANTFGSISTSFEVDVTSQNFRYMTRLSHFHNLPELMSLFSGVCDFYHIGKDDMKLPDFNGYKDIVVEKTSYHDIYNRSLASRTDICRNGRVSSKDDNILKIITDGRKSALDIRLVEPDAIVSENECKAGVCAKQVAELYYAHPGTTQIIFCDYSAPKKEWNVYDEIKRYLVKKGIPDGEIAFIQDGTNEKKKNKMLRDFEEGRIRVMIGSTPMLGVGVNVQKNLLALHHVDAPWRPSDLSQREGRLIRQGNLNPEVFIYRYMTSGSFDSYVWQILENKQHFIGSFLAGSLSQFHRDESDVDMIRLDYSEVKALAIGNPLIKERIETANLLERAKVSKRQREKQLISLNSDIPKLERSITVQKQKIENVCKDIVFFDSHKVSLDEKDREYVGLGVLKALNNNINMPEMSYLTTYMGFDIYLPKDMTVDDRHVLISGKGGEFYKADMQDKNAVGVTRTLDGVLRGITKRKEKLEKGLAEFEKQLSYAKNEVSKGNPYKDEVINYEELLQNIDDQLNLDDETK